MGRHEQEIMVPIVEGERIGTLRTELIHKRRALTELRNMQRDGEIKCAFNPRIVTVDGTRYWEVDYVRLRDPKSKWPVIVGCVFAGWCVVAGIAWLMYYSRWVILAGVAAALVLVFGATFLGSRSGGSGKCEGVHVRH